ncbi:MAG: hypothetical protein ACP5G1_00935 [Nanopusillaceae archaeon]
MEKALVKILNNKFILDKKYYDKIGRIGKMEKEYIYLDPEEVLYCLKKGWITIENIKNFEEFLEKYYDKIDFKKYYVFEDLRNKGYYTEIRDIFIVVYENEKKEKISYYIYPIFEQELLYVKEILEIMDKYGLDKIILGIIDIEKEIVYYEIKKINL